MVKVIVKLTTSDREFSCTMQSGPGQGLTKMHSPFSSWELLLVEG